MSMSHIKGYPIFKITAHKKIKIQVLEESNDQKEPNTMLLKMVGLKEMLLNLLHAIT